jgi:hypothetical protein
MPPDSAYERELSAAQGDLDRLTRRLRSLSARARAERSAVISAALHDLVAIAAAVEGRPLAPPAVADHVLADAVAVIGADVLERLVECPDELRLAAAGRVLGRTLDETR